ncbi:MAG: fluoride efflux transporter CrcB [Lachnospiraceae bacterium]|nr:fluoride efflux transporter CrcB [Lachnospiraceae bacterium]
MLNIIMVGLGGFVGAVCRYLIGLIPINEVTVFPIKTFMINIVGCIVIGIITVVATRNNTLNPQLLLFLKVGVCGGFTTFSTFALETAELIKNGNALVALAYMLGSVLVGVGVIFAIEYFAAKWMG